MTSQLQNGQMELTNLEQQSLPKPVRRFNQILSPATNHKFRPSKSLLTQQLDVPQNLKQSGSKSGPKELEVHLQNLYINPKTYRPDYNFYNYNRFNQTHAIPIIYKTPSIFLNGLHFELPIANIIGISKSPETQTIRLSVKISRQDFQSAVSFDDIYAVFRKIEEYNTDFFEKNASKMDIKIRRTLKNTSSNGQLSLQSPPQSVWQFDDNIPANRFKNPGSRKLEYRPFYDSDGNGDNINLTLEIKQPYLAKIIQSQYLTLTSRHITNQAEITEPIRQYIQQIERLSETLNLEFFELKKKKIDINLAMRPISIRLWVKCNMFSLDSSENKIAMRWKVCYYEC
jgi:hypothetical protein